MNSKDCIPILGANDVHNLSQHNIIYNSLSLFYIIMLGHFAKF